MIDLFWNIRKVLLPREKLNFLGLTFLLCIGAVLELIGIGAILPLIALFVNPQLLHDNDLLHTLYSFCGSPSDTSFMMMLCAGIAFCFIFKNLLLYAMTVYQSRFSYYVSGRVSKTMLEKYLGAPLQFHLSHDTGELLELVKETRFTFSQILTSTIMLLSESLMVLAVFAVSLYAAPAATLCILGAGFLFSLIMFVIVRKLLNEASKRVFGLGAQLSGFIITCMACLREIKLSDRLPLFIRKGNAVQDRLSETDSLMFSRQQMPRFVIEAGAVIIGMTTIILLLYGGYSTDELAVKISFIGIAMVRLLPSFSRIHYYVARFRAQQDIFTRICHILSDVFPEEMPEGPVLTLEKELHLEDLCFSYGEKKILDHVDLVLPAKGSLALIGPTGCGKSTLLDMIAGLTAPQSGKITADGMDIRSNLHSWRSRIGYVPQTVVIADASVLENVAFGVPPEQIDRARVAECLRIAQALPFAAALPQGLDTPLGEMGSHISGGQRQRIGIARALYPNPEILLFDEATSALDAETEAAFVQALHELSGRVTMIIAAHRLSTIENCTVKYRFSGKSA